MKPFWPRVPIEDSPSRPLVDRGIACVVIAVAIVFVSLLSSVEADPRGHGTHESLGMEPCSWPGQLGIPCPTCGVTTAATLMVHLSPIQSIVTQPFGAFLTLVGLWSAFIAAFCLARRRSFVAWIGFLPYGSIVVFGTVLLLLSWGYLWWTWDTV